MHVYGKASDGTAALASESYIPLFEYAWSDTMSNAGLIRDAIYLVRPDGYVGYMGSQSEQEVGSYIEKWIAAKHK
jgi:hypothetical protein